MSTEQSSFEIKINTSANTAGAKDAAASLEKLKDSSGGAGASLERAAGSASKATLSHAQLHKIIVALNGAVPGLGYAFQAMASPITAAIGIAVMALSSFREKIKEINEEMDRASEEAAKPLSNRLQIMRESTVTSAVAMEEFKIKLHEAAAGEKTLAESMAETVQHFQKQTAEADSLGDALKNNELSQLEMMRSAGLVSTEKYEAEKFAIEEKYAALKRQLQESQMASDIKLQAATLDTAKKQQPALEQAAKDAMDKFKAADINAKDIDSKIQNYPGEIKEAQKKLAEFEKQIGNRDTEIYKRAGADASDDDLKKAMFELGGHYSSIHDFSENYITWKGLQKNATNTQQLYDKALKDQPDAHIATKAAEGEWDRAQQRAVKNQEYTTQGNVDLRNKIITYNAQREMNQQLGAIEHNANQDRLEGQYAARERQLSGKAQFTDDEAQSAQFLQGRHPGISLDQHLAQFQASTDRIHGTIKDFARRIAATQDKLDKDVQTIAQELNNQQSSIRANLDH